MAAWPKKFEKTPLIAFSTTPTVGPDSYSVSNDFILTDHGRSDLDISVERIETAQRMIDGTYRTHYVTEKKTFSISWSDVPSVGAIAGGAVQLTADGFAGGQEIVNYLTQKPGPFYIKFTSHAPILAGYGQPNDTYPSHSARVIIQSYSSVTKRRGQYFDMMDVSITLAEV